MIEWKADSPAPWFRRPSLILLFVVGIVYLLLIGRYRAADLDDVWCLAFSHSFWYHHIQTDTLMLQPFPSGMGGVVAFGKLAALLQGAVLGLVGWTLPAGLLISIVLVLAGLALLRATSLHLGYGEHFTACFIALVGLTESFVSAAEKTRYEFLALFLLCLALWLAAHRSVGISILVAALATEVQPSAIVIPFAVFVAVLVFNRRFQQPLRRLLLPRAALGALGALGIYLLLHPDIVSVFRHAYFVTLKFNAYPGGFVVFYYVGVKRHLAELLLLFAAVAMACTPAKRAVLRDWPALCCLAIAAVSAALRWDNPTYFCFFSPFVCFFITQTLFHESRWKWIIAAILLYTLPQYAYRAYFWESRHAVLSVHDEKQVALSIDQAAAILHKSPSALNILGNYNFWYAHPDNFVSLDSRIFSPVLYDKADLIVCSTDRIDALLDISNYEIPCGKIGIHTNLLGSVVVNHHAVELRAPVP